MKSIFKDICSSFKKLLPYKKMVIILLVFLYVVLILGTTIKVNYEVLTPGSINETVSSKVEDKDYSVIKINTDYASGDVNTVGVYSHIRVTLFQYIIAQLSNDISFRDYNPETDLSKEEDYKRGVILKDYSIDYAIITAYNMAKALDPSILLDYEFEGIVVSAVFKETKTSLKPGDIIKKINGQTFSSHAEFTTILNSINENDSFELTYQRDEELITETTSKYKQVDSENNSSYKLGVEASEKYKLNGATSSPSFSIATKIRSIGSSGGAMMALSIYNALIEDDITKDLKIVGTGTISVNGKIGAIGGVEQKIVTAHLNKADVFFIPEIHYEVALKQYNLINANFKLVKVKTMTDILDYLEAYNG